MYGVHQWSGLTSACMQELAVLLRKLKSGGHKALIFTQMARMLDVLEVFLNLHGYTYVRLDGTTKPEQRQILMQRYNTNPKLFIFILSTRSGGVGMNLTGADTVIFYDSDWNPAMDAQVCIIPRARSEWSFMSGTACSKNTNQGWLPSQTKIPQLGLLQPCHVC